MEVTIQATKTEYIDEDPSTCWNLKFLFSTKEAIFTFISEEPYLVSFESWKRLCVEEGRRVNLYMGNGDGSITHRNGKFEFMSFASGAGGDTVALFKINAELVKDKLLGALENAVNQGLRFL